MELSGRRRRGHRGRSCNSIAPGSSVVICSLSLFLLLSIDIFRKSNSDSGSILTTTVTMAWTIRRSFSNRLAVRSVSSSFSSLFLLTTPSTTGALSFLRDPRSNGGCSRSIVSSPASSTTRLYNYRDFLEQEEHDNILVSCVTDIEGDKFYLDRYVDNSKILSWIPNEQKKEETITTPAALSLYSSSGIPPSDSFPYDRRIGFRDSNSMLVFVGDVWDKGGFDLYVTRQLLDLKQRHPNRVVWVLGNREINKLRMSQELGSPLPSGSSSSPPEVSVPYHPGLTWFNGSGRVGDPEGNLPSMDPGERLRWILGKTMGSPDAMEYRRQELLWEANGCNDADSRCYGGEETETATKDSEATISDLDVVRSYQESCHPNGEMGRFLSEGMLAAKVGPLLFVHGCLPLTKDAMAKAREEKTSNIGSSIWDDLTFCMPWIHKTHHDDRGEDQSEKLLTASDFGVESIDDWLEAVNRFCSESVVAWKNHIAQLENESDTNNEQEQNKDTTESYKEESKDAIWAYRTGYGNGPSHSGIHYSDLIQYGMGIIPGGKKNPTVVYNYFTPEGMPLSFLPPEEQLPNGHEDNDGKSSKGLRVESPSESDLMSCTREFFERSTVQLIVTGHKPQGDMPTSIKVDESSWVVCADTSYSADTGWFHDDKNATSPEKMEQRQGQKKNLGRGTAKSSRGDATVSEVLIKLSKGAASLESVLFHGVLSDGTKYESVDLLDADYSADSAENNDGNNDPVFFGSMGQVAPKSVVPDPSISPHGGRWWTKGIFRDGSRLYYAGEGIEIWNYIVSPSESKVGGTNDATEKQ